MAQPTISLLQAAFASSKAASAICCGRVYCNHLLLSTHLKEDIAGSRGGWDAPLRAPKLETLSSSSDFPFPQGEWPRLPFTARIERAQFHRARSASKKGTWPLPPSLPSSLVISSGMGLIDLPLRATFSPAHPPVRRDVPLALAMAFGGRACASTEDHQAPPHSFELDSLPL